MCLCCLGMSRLLVAATGSLFIVTLLGCGATEPTGVALKAPPGQQAVVGGELDWAPVAGPAAGGVRTSAVAPAVSRRGVILLPVTGGLVGVPGLMRGEVQTGGGLRLRLPGRTVILGGMRVELESGAVIARTPAGEAVRLARLVDIRRSTAGLRARALIAAEGAAFLALPAGGAPLANLHLQLRLASTQDGGAGPGPTP